LCRKFLGKQNGTEQKSQQSILSFNKKEPDTTKTASPESSANDAESEDIEMLDGAEENGPSPAAAKDSTPPTSVESRGKNHKRTISGEDEDDDSDIQPVSKRRKKDAEPVTTGIKRSTKPVKEIPTHSKSNGTARDTLGPKSDVARSPSALSPAAEKENGCEEEEGASASEAEEIVKIDKKKVGKMKDMVMATAKDPYPDWKAGDPVPYAALCTTFSLVELTTKRLQISAHCALFLQQVLRLTPNDLLPTIQLMINKLAADYAGIELGIGESLIMKAISESTGRSLAVVKTDQQKIGDLGLVAAKSRGKQSQFMKPKPLTVRGVHESLLDIAKMEGHGSQDKKVGAIRKLMAAADVNSKTIDIETDKGGPSESKFIVRFLEGKLRLGLAEKTVIVALAHAIVNHETAQKGNKLPSTEALAKGEAELKLVYSELPSYEVIIPAMLEHGLSKLHESCKLQPGVPLKPMLAKPTKSITEVLDRFEGKDFTCEYKYDGERAQIHYVAPEAMSDFPAASSTLVKDPKAFKGLASIFSRNSEDLSKKYPDILEKINAWVKSSTKSFVLDCETVAWDLQQKKVLPFQQLMTRKRKDVKASDITVKVCVFAFDLLFYNGEATVKKTLRERRELLHEAFEPVEGEFAFAQFGDSKEIDEIQLLLDESVKSGCEGLMVKMLDTEESGYEPSKRSRNWLKVKKDYLSGIGDSLDLVVLGAYFGAGKRTGWYGAFLLAAYNPDTENYEAVCNIGTGFSEEKLEEFHKEFSELVIEKPKPYYLHSSGNKDQPDVWFEARHVWEVKTADLTLSPRYMAAMEEMGVKKGISLRFPRFIQRRDDKKTEEATTTKAVAEMYRKQESVGKESKVGVDDDFEY
jgi:DNA ligase-1